MTRVNSNKYNRRMPDLFLSHGDPVTCVPMFASGRHHVTKYSIFSLLSSFFGKSLNLDVWTDKFKYTILVCARLLYSSQYSHAYFWARCQVALLNRQYSLITVFRFFLSDHNILITLTSFLIEHWNKAVFFSRGFFWHFLPFRWFSSFSRFLLFSCLKMRKSERRRLFSVCCWVEVEKETEAMLIGRPMGARGRAHDG